MNIDKPEISHELARLIQGIPKRREFIEAAQAAANMEEFRQMVKDVRFGTPVKLY